ncbi:hypothetical protein [Pseudoduganella namucuonensis]|nr:hypothetical protein [Pseudoduganella namucuonensis]
MTPELSLSSLYQLMPPSLLVHVGAGHGRGPKHVWHEWPIERVLLIDPDAERLAWAHAAAAHKPGWQVRAAAVSDHHTAQPFYRANNPGEDGLAAPELLVPFWPGLFAREIDNLVTERLDRLVASAWDARFAGPMWLLIDCLPSLPILEGAGALLDQCTFVQARCVLEPASDTPPAWRRDNLASALAARGFRQIGVSAGNQPAVGDAWFVRDWSRSLQADDELRAQIAQQQHQLALQANEYAAADQARQATAGELADLAASLASARQAQDSAELLARTVEQGLNDLYDALATMPKPPPGALSGAHVWPPASGEPAGLEPTLRACQGSLTRVMAECARLEQLRSAGARALSDAAQQAAAREQQLGEQAAMLQQRDQELLSAAAAHQAKDKQIAALEEELRRNLAEAAEQHREKGEQITALTAMRGELDAQLDALRLELSRAGEQHREKDEQIITLAALRGELGAQLDALRLALARAGEQHQEKDEQITELTTLRNELHAQLDALRMELARAGEQHLEKDEQINALATLRNELDAQLDALRVELAKAGEQHVEKDEQINALAPLRGELDAQLAALRVELAKAGEQHVEKDEQINALTTLRGELDVQLEALRVELAKAGEQHVEKDEQINALATLRGELGAQLAALRVELAKAGEQHVEKDEQIAVLTAAMDELTSARTAKTDELAMQVGRLRSELLERGELLALREAELQESQRVVQQLAEEVAKAEAQIELIKDVFLRPAVL